MTNDPHGPIHPLPDSDPGPGVDPVNRWATEHYGFDDDVAAPVAPAAREPAVVAPAAAPGSRVARRRAVLVGGVLGLVLTGGVGGAAIAAVADDVGGAGRGGVARFGGDDVGGDDGRRGGSR